MVVWSRTASQVKMVVVVAVVVVGGSDVSCHTHAHLSLHAHSVVVVAAAAMVVVNVVVVVARWRDGDALVQHDRARVDGRHKRAGKIPVWFGLVWFGLVRERKERTQETDRFQCRTG